MYVNNCALLKTFLFTATLERHHQLHLMPLCSFAAISTKPPRQREKMRKEVVAINDWRVLHLDAESLRLTFQAIGFRQDSILATNEGRSIIIIQRAEIEKVARCFRRPPPRFFANNPNGHLSASSKMVRYWTVRESSRRRPANWLVNIHSMLIKVYEILVFAVTNANPSLDTRAPIRTHPKIMPLGDSVTRIRLQVLWEFLSLFTVPDDPNPDLKITKRVTLNLIVHSPRRDEDGDVSMSVLSSNLYCIVQSFGPWGHCPDHAAGRNSGGKW